eukprot:g10905.t1
MRRHFWVDLQKVELCWAKTKSEGEEPQVMSLRDSVGLIDGPMTTTFQRCETLEDQPWTCFSILFSDRTLDMAVPAQMESWFLGLQFYLFGRSNCISCVTEAQFVFRRVFHKLSASAHKHGFTVWVHLKSRLKALGEDKAFREALDKARAGGAFTYQAQCEADPEAEALDAKAARRAERAARRAARESRASQDGGTAGEKSRAATDVPLATFDGAAASSFEFKELNDPVMGGQSHGTWHVDQQQKLGIFDGEVLDVPSLKAPGFIKAAADGHFPDASATAHGGLVLKLRSSTPNYEAWALRR